MISRRLSTLSTSKRHPDTMKIDASLSELGTNVTGSGVINTPQATFLPNASTLENVYRTPLGPVLIYGRTANGNVNSGTATLHRSGASHDDIWKLQFHSTRWLWRGGCIVIGLSYLGNWQYTFRTYSIIDNSSIFDACGNGDIRLVRELLREGKVGLWDTDLYGRTMLHVGVMWVSRQPRRWLTESSILQQASIQAPASY